MKRYAARRDAYEDFGQAILGDVRRTDRVVSMATTAYAQPAGRVLQVFSTSAARQGAYDLLGNEACAPEALTLALGSATANRCAMHTQIFVSVDGSSLSLVDHTKKKGFGRIGTTRSGGRGLKVITAYAIGADGVPIGVLDQQWWSRVSARKRHDCHARTLENKETKYWVDALESSKIRLSKNAPSTRVWFLLDRENDRRHCLDWLMRTDATYVVRSSYNRRLDDDGKRYLLEELCAAAPMHEYLLAVNAGAKRTARIARMTVRAIRVRLRLRGRAGARAKSFETTVVEAREEGTTPPGESPIAWRLLTNHAVQTQADADQVIEAYATRWRIEDFHKTWKTGACNVEDTQLRSKSAVVKWATIMAGSASRIERLKHLSRSEPELPANRELTFYELAAIVTLKRREKRRNEIIPLETPTLAQAIWWLAELGGYTGKSSGGPPGSITIRRGFDRIAPVAAAIEQLERDGKLR